MGAMFSRLFKYWEDHHKAGGDSPVLKLAQQYRMHPRILEWPNRYFYGGLLRTPDSVARRSQFEPLMLLDLGTTFEDEGSKNSTFNMQEASFVGDLAKEVLNGISLHAMGGPKSVGIITFYNGQREKIGAELQKRGIPLKDKDGNDDGKDGKIAVSVRTVDGYQGSECDVIIISCVKSRRRIPQNANSGQGKEQAQDRGGSNGIGFLADPQRLNVALTRAKFSLLIVGNFTVLERNKLWSSMVQDAKARKAFVTIDKNSPPINRLIRMHHHTSHPHDRKSNSSSKSKPT